MKTKILAAAAVALIAAAAAPAHAGVLDNLTSIPRPPVPPSPTLNNNSNSNSNANYNANHNANYNANAATAGAAAGAAAGAISGSVSKSDATATGGSAYAGGGSATAAGGSATAAGGSAVTGNSSAVVGDLTPSAVVNYTVPSEQRTVPSMSAPDIQPTAPCIVSHSAAVSGLGFGVAGGTGMVDESCEVREFSRLMYAYGHAAAAKELLCADPRVAAAYERAGSPCTAVLKAASAPAARARMGDAVVVDGTPTCYADPLVARRAGVDVCL